MRLPPDHSSPARARALVQRSLERCECPVELVDDAQLLVSELVTNAVVHAQTPLEVKVHVGLEQVRVEVQDESDALPIARLPASESTGGRGLQLVERTARSWGIERRRPGKIVWFELATNAR